MAYIKLPISSQPLMIPASDFPSLRVVFYTTMVDIKLLVSIQHLPIPANDFPSLRVVFYTMMVHIKLPISPQTLLIPYPQASDFSFRVVLYTP
jgi:hypothetical protein